MSSYLLAAEADKIQDLLFRSARLREVVGGSQLLSRFCEQGAEALLQKHKGNPKDDLIVNDGGAFRILFHGDHARDTAIKFGNDLAELYRRCTGGSLTVAEPVPYDPPAFDKANTEAHDELRKAKNRGDIAASVLHLPFTAFCASCGMGMAIHHKSRFEEDVTERPNYLCQSCINKAVERDRQEGLQTDVGFLDRFRETIWKQAGWNEGEYPLRRPDGGDWTEAIAKFDPKRYVAYLLADGNAMGAVFKQCSSKEKMRALSLALSQSLRAALAEPCVELLKRQLRQEDKDVLPVLPLILGGDDLFALLPAPWALDYAARFCSAYEENMKTALTKVGLFDPNKPPIPTIAAAVVICKANYPYMLAHQRGEKLLAHAKEIARRLQIEREKYFSTLNFEVITGNQLGRVPDAKIKGHYPSLRPYFVSSTPLPEAGLSVEKILKHRLELKYLPNKRRAEFEQFYDPADFQNKDFNEDEWLPGFQGLRSRIARSESLSKKLRQALIDLGDEAQAEKGYWKRLSLPRKRNDQGYHGHGLPDLLMMWSYAHKLDESLSKYAGE
ncbi:hypothetical protein HUU39_05730 [candidate division KSB1 bacterium]|nr:hypothetical protein [bacterium]NUM64761.1 hypothetical protein [candidate division KSB1 bacterium]